MKKSVMIIACMVSFAFLLAVPSALAQADKLVGVWKATEINFTDPRFVAVFRHLAVILLAEE